MTNKRIKEDERRRGLKRMTGVMADVERVICSDTPRPHTDDDGSIMGRRFRDLGDEDSDLDDTDRML